MVPFGGGTCVTGGLAARRDGYSGVVSLDLGRLTDVSVDPVSMTAVLGPGLRGPEAEAALAELADADTTGESFAKGTVEVTPGGN